MRSRLTGLAMFVTVITVAITVRAQVMDKKSLTIEGAKRVIAAAVAEAKRLNAPGGVIAVVDDGGNLMALERLDGTFAAGANISIGKARTSVMFKRPTKVFEDIIKNGRTAMVALPDAFFTPLQGGVPITVNGQIVGGIGVSGAASAQQDEELAIAGANAFNNPEMVSTPVVYFEKERVASAFAQGVGRDQLIGAVDSRAGHVVIDGWKTALDLTAVEAVQALEPYCGEFLYTHVDTEGLMRGIPMDAVLAVSRATTRHLIAAGGITTQSEIDALDAVGIDAVVGMAIYTRKLALE